MMKNSRIVAVLATISLLVGSFAVGGLLPASATTDGWTAGTVGQYKAWPQSTQLSAIMGKDATNLILGKTAYGSAYNSTDCGDDDTTVSNWYHETDATHSGNYPGYAGGATDGVIGNHNNRKTTEEIFRSNNTSTLRYFYYDLGAVYDVSDFIVASSQCNLDAANRVLKYIDVYVAQEWKETASFTTHKGAFTTGNFTQVFGWSDASSETYIHHIQPADGATVAARYVCFVFKGPSAANGSAAPIPINELAVYGTLPVPAEESAKPLGGQVAGGYSAEADFAQLRMGFNVTATGVTAGEDYVGDYTNAQVTVSGKSYPIATDDDGRAIIGALVARSTMATDADLVLDGTNAEVQNVHAAKIYEIDTDDITFTALVTNVPNAYFAEPIISRAYVGYVDGETVRYVYGDVLSCSVNSVANNAELA